ncbi:RNA polymerase sigma factor [Sphingobacterium sp. SG20118]|uniref:RNA polymerase sigma factor n=1 Tax=Sphingobacterium sp. SG20118 TaxID=3367156 RepID=UPI0037DFC0EA
MGKKTFSTLIDDPDQGIRLIVEHYRVQLLRQIRRFIHNDDELVKEVFQLTLIEIWKDHRNIGEMADPFVWIMAIARNIALSTLRAERKHLKEPIENHVDVCSNEQADTELVYQETLNELMLQATELTPKEKEIFIGSKVDGMDNKELEKVHKLTPQRVRNLLSFCKEEDQEAIQALIGTFN